MRRYGAPHLDWLVLALGIQRERQRWHHQVAREVYQDADDDEGELPGHPGWSYYRHGIGVCLGGPDGEVLDVDFEDEDGQRIDTWFFARRIESLQRSPDRIVEPRLWRWRPRRELIVDGIRELEGAGAVHYPTAYENKIVLAADLEAELPEVIAELATVEGRARWLAELEPGGEQAHVEAHRAWVRDRLAASKRPGDLLELALADTTPEQAVELCRPLFGRKDWHEGRAIELLRRRADVPVLPEVIDVLRNADPRTDHPFSPYQACAFLLERDADRELVLEAFDAWTTIDKAEGYGAHPLISEFAALALEHVPDRALRVVRHGLRHGVPIAIAELAALLAAIDQPWCHRELAAAAAEQRRESHSYLAAALLATSSELAQRRGAAVPGPSPRAPGAIGFTFDEVLHNMADGEMAGHIDKQRALAARLRDKYPNGL